MKLLLVIRRRCRRKIVKMVSRMNMEVNLSNFSDYVLKTNYAIYKHLLFENPNIKDVLENGVGDNGRFLTRVQSELELYKRVTTEQKNNLYRGRPIPRLKFKINFNEIQYQNQIECGLFISPFLVIANNVFENNIETYMYNMYTIKQNTIFERVVAMYSNQLENYTLGVERCAFQKFLKVYRGNTVIQIYFFDNVNINMYPQSIQSIEDTVVRLYCMKPVPTIDDKNTVENIDEHIDLDNIDEEIVRLMSPYTVFLNFDPYNTIRCDYLMDTKSQIEGIDANFVTKQHIFVEIQKRFFVRNVVFESRVNTLNECLFWLRNKKILNVYKKHYIINANVQAQDFDDERVLLIIVAMDKSLVMDANRTILETPPNKEETFLPSLNNNNPKRIDNEKLIKFDTKLILLPHEPDNIYDIFGVQKLFNTAFYIKRFKTLLISSFELVHLNSATNCHKINNENRFIHTVNYNTLEQFKNLFKNFIKCEKISLSTLPDISIIKVIFKEVYTYVFLSPQEMCIELEELANKICSIKKNKLLYSNKNIILLESFYKLKSLF